MLTLSVWTRYMETARAADPSVPEVAFPENGYKGELHPRLRPRALRARRQALGRAALPADIEPIKQFAIERALGMIRATLERFDVAFDVWQSERALHDAGDVDETLRALDAKGYIDRHDDAVWLKTTALWGDDKDRVVVKSDGLPTYLLADIAYHRKKLARGFDELCDIWGSDHHGHIARMQAALKAFGFDPAVLRVILIQNVSLLRDGVEVKMGKRAGEFVTLDDVIEEVGRDATRYFYLMRRHDTPLEFDLEVAKRQSMDNPVYYVQYGHARCAAIKRRAAELEAPRPPLDPALAAELALPEEIAILRRLADFPDFVADAAAAREPHRADDLPDRAGGRVPELLHPPAEGARRHHPAPGAPPDGRLAGDLELAQDGGPAVLGRRHRPGDAQRAGAAGRLRPGGDGARDGFGSRGPLSHERGRFMTVRYTAIEGMEEPALRDVDRNAERWRDKIEVRLDNRQVFFLFFGSAVVACMLFVLGVMVGKRIESRGQAGVARAAGSARGARSRAHAVAGVAPAPAPQLTFPNTLIAPSREAREGDEARLGGARAEARARGGAAQAARRRRGAARPSRSPPPSRRSRPSRSRPRQGERRPAARGAAGRRAEGRCAPRRAEGGRRRAGARAEAGRRDGRGRRRREGEGQVHAAPQHVRDRRGGERVRAALPGRLRRRRRRPGPRAWPIASATATSRPTRTRRPPRTTSRSSTT